ncbi:hypothetical protein GYMLUDRAFT_70784 [Collybiopsis luxurians FD-317 M1]|nr:hypothetical protein GYMLUDRAFT_70784 [Collybiopsis luxurians FD-317 M1]
MDSDTVFFICDIQSRFRSAIHQYEHVIATTSKMLKFAKLFGIPVVVTTQNAKALGPVDPALDLDSLGALHVKTIDKTLFGMLTEEVKDILNGHGRPIVNVVIMGIESHICIIQTALQLLQFYDGRVVNVYVVADGVSSCNAFEVPIAFDAMRHAGVKILSSESIGFILMKDASFPTFKEFARIIRDSKENTKAAGDALLLGRPSLKEKSSM